MGFLKAKESEIRALVDEYHLDNLSPEAIDIVRKIAKDYSFDQMNAAFAQFTFNSKDYTTIASFTTLIRQNWIIINQLAELTEVMKSIKEKQEEKIKEPEEDQTAPKKVETNTEVMTECSIADAIQFLSFNGKTYIDNTPKCGYLWILDDEEVREWIKNKIIDGKVPQYTSCSGALRGCPGWYV